MDKMPELVMTERAKGFANIWATEAEIMDLIEADLLRELANANEGGEEYDWSGLIMHLFYLNDSEDSERAFVIVPHEDVLLVDVATFDMVELTEGPFAGKMLMMPHDPREDL